MTCFRISKVWAKSRFKMGEVLESLSRILKLKKSWEEKAWRLLGSPILWIKKNSKLVTADWGMVILMLTASPTYFWPLLSRTKIKTKSTKVWSYSIIFAPMNKREISAASFISRNQNNRISMMLKLEVIQTFCSLTETEFSSTPQKELLTMNRSLWTRLLAPYHQLRWLLLST